MKIKATEIELIDVMELTPNPNNTKLHTKKQIDVLVKSMKKVGFNDPIQVDENNVILAGHGRLKAAKKIGIVKVPCIRLLGMSETEKRAYTISHNQIGAMTGMDEQMLVFEIEQLKKDDFELDCLGFDAAKIDELLGMNEEEEAQDPLGDASSLLPGVIQLSRAMAIPDDEWVEPYGFPALREDRLAEAEDQYKVWIGRNRTDDDGETPFWYLYGSDSTVGMDASRTTVAFYVDDVRFERVWNNLPEWTTKFMTAGVRTLVQPNFSVMQNQSKAVSLYQTYRCKYIARYWQEAGFSVIPDLEFGNMEDIEFTCMGLPKEVPSMATQIQAYNGSDDQREDEIRQGFALAFSKVRPLKLIVYAGEPGLRIGKEVCERYGIQFVGILNRAAHMRADVAKHEATRAF